MSQHTLDISVLFRRNTIDILQQLSQEPKRFSELEDLPSSSSTISKRVKLMERLGFIEREARVFPAKPVEVFYKITWKGTELINQYNYWVNLVETQQKLR